MAAAGRSSGAGRGRFERLLGVAGELSVGLRQVELAGPPPRRAENGSPSEQRLEQQQQRV